MKWIMSLKEGDIVAQVARIPESKGFGQFKLWPIEYVKRSYKSKLITQLYNDDVVDLSHMNHKVIPLQPRGHMLITGSEIGYINCNCDRVSWLAYHYAGEDQKKKIRRHYEEILGEGAFDVTSSTHYSLRVPYPHVLILGTGEHGYIEPHILKRVKGE